MIYKRIGQLIDYAVKHKLVAEEDKIYSINRLLEILALDEYIEEELVPCDNLEEILSDICDFAFEKGLIESNSVVYRDLFDTKIMGTLTPAPSVVIKNFKDNYKVSPEKATDEYYAFAKASDYIRTYRVKKDLRWKTPSAYGDIDITINLSKPEKDPKAIAAAKLLPQAGYPKCLLCCENEGYAGRLNSPARQNHRIIPITLNEAPWYLQYSPYVYYNEHCILLSKDHVPMVISDATFKVMLDFIEYLPHYFIGSNADLPIVGGSILTHNHMQGGHYTFAMETAPIEKKISFKGYENIKAGIVKWPLSVIRLQSKNKAQLCELADKILVNWRGYTDKEAFIFAETDGEKHNTITPIARMHNGEFELDLVLRNNITTKEHPLGVYHPHAELHNIKKENIGLIEVMGLAVLPARLKEEIAIMKDAILSGKSFKDNPDIEKHAEWFAKFKDNYTFTAENTEDILCREIGNTFVKVLEDAGVYKCDENGRCAFVKFIESIK